MTNTQYDVTRASGFPDSIIDVRAKTVEDGVVTHLLYNPFSLDSMLAAAIALGDPKLGRIVVIPYDRFNGLDTMVDYKHIFCAGVELSEYDFTSCVTKSTHLTLTAYRDSYAFLDQKKLKKWGDQITLIMPTSEFINSEIAAMDNCASKLLQIHYYPDFPVPSLRRYVDHVARYTNFMPFKASLEDDGDSTAMQQPVVQAMLLGLSAALRSVLYSSNPMELLKDFNVREDVSAYMSHFQNVRMGLRRGLHHALYGTRGNAINVPTMAITEPLFHDTCINALITFESFVGYEDTRTHRVWRIYADKLSTRQYIAKYLKPHEMWSEGAVLCVSTDRPVVNL